MKVPFRQQVTNYDCVPTSLINALSYLFVRSEIPPSVVQGVYKKCLDVESARGTSAHAMQEISNWLSTYQERRFKKFAVKARFLSGDKVHLKRNSRIIRCIKENGAALVCVHHSQKETHCILGFQIDGRWLHFYDPAPHTKRFINHAAVEFFPKSGHQEPNLRIHFNWLEKNFNATKSPHERKYILGAKSDRECLLLKRIDV